MSFSDPSVALEFYTPLEASKGFWGFWFFFGVEQGGDINASKISSLRITEVSPPIIDELFFVYPLVPLSALSTIEDFFDVVVIITF